MSGAYSNMSLSLQDSCPIYHVILCAFYVLHVSHMAQNSHATSFLRLNSDGYRLTDMGLRVFRLNRAELPPAVMPATQANMHAINYSSGQPSSGVNSMSTQSNDSCSDLGGDDRERLHSLGDDKVKLHPLLLECCSMLVRL